MDMKRTIVLLCLPGCPNCSLARDRLIEALGRKGESATEVVVEELSEIQAAKREDFVGSPTVLVEGVDPFRGDVSGKVVACRLYGSGGAPTIEQLEAVL